MDESSVVLYFASLHITLKDNWLKDALMFTKFHEKAKSVCQLRGSLLEMFLFSDLVESYVSPLRIPPTAARLVIVKPVVLQILEVINITKSVYEQYRECSRESDDLSWFNGEDDNSENDHHHSSVSLGSGGRRMLRLRLSDGAVETQAIEFGQLNCITDSTLPGTKIMLTARVMCRRGIMLINDSNCQLLGGEVDTLVKAFDRIALLANKIGVKLDKSNKRKPLQTQLKTTTAGANTSHMSTISPFLVRMPSRSKVVPPTLLENVAVIKDEIECISDHPTSPAQRQLPNPVRPYSVNSPLHTDHMDLEHTPHLVPVSAPPPIVEMRSVSAESYGPPLAAELPPTALVDKYSRSALLSNISNSGRPLDHAEKPCLASKIRSAYRADRMKKTQLSSTLTCSNLQATEAVADVLPPSDRSAVTTSDEDLRSLQYGLPVDRSVRSSLIPQFEMDMMQTNLETVQQDIPITSHHQRVMPHVKKLPVPRVTSKGKNQQPTGCKPISSYFGHPEAKKKIVSDGDDLSDVPSHTHLSFAPQKETASLHVPSAFPRIIPMITLSQMDDSHDADVELSSTSNESISSHVPNAVPLPSHRPPTRKVEAPSQILKRGGTTTNSTMLPDVPPPAVLPRNEAPKTQTIAPPIVFQPESFQTPQVLDRRRANRVEPQRPPPVPPERFVFAGREHIGAVTPARNLFLAQSPMVQHNMLSPYPNLCVANQFNNCANEIGTEKIDGFGPPTQKFPTPTGRSPRRTFGSQMDEQQTEVACKRMRVDVENEGVKTEEPNASFGQGPIDNVMFSNLFAESMENELKVAVPAPLTSDSIRQRFREFEIVSIQDALSRKVFWMLPKIVNVQGICRVPLEMKTRDGQWLMPVMVTDDSAVDMFCDTSPLLLERLLGFTVQSCQDPQVMRNRSEVMRRKSRAVSVARSFLRLDLILSIEMYPQAQSVPLVLDVKTMWDALQL